MNNDKGRPTGESNEDNTRNNRDDRGENEKHYHDLYIDGACTGNGTAKAKASWAVHCPFDQRLDRAGLVTKDASNQTGELTAAIEACKLAHRVRLNNIKIITDSNYVYLSQTKWIEKWRGNDFSDHRNRQIKNIELFKKLEKLQDGLNVKWSLVKGHSNVEGNERADNLAKCALAGEVSQILAIDTTAADIVEAQEDDKDCQRLRRELGKDVGEGEVQDIDGVLYLVNETEQSQRIIVPKNRRTWILKMAHDNQYHGSHLGIKKTLIKLKQFWWPRMRGEVENYVKSCHSCQIHKRPPGKPFGVMKSLRTSELFERLHIDIIGPKPVTHSGNMWIITAVDAFSKWAITRAVPETSTEQVLNFLLEDIVAKHGPPKAIFSDRGAQFTSALMGHIEKFFDIKRQLTAPYHPQGNGACERFNGTIQRMLKHYVTSNQKNWDKALTWATYAYNTTPHETTTFTPYEILYGREHRSPLNEWKEKTFENTEYMTHDYVESLKASIIKINTHVQNISRESQDHQKKYYDQNHRPHNFQVGDLVLVNNPGGVGLAKKFTPLTIGPYKITKFILDEAGEQQAIEIDDTDRRTRRIVSINNAKKYNARQHTEADNSCEQPIQSETQEDRQDSSPERPMPIPIPKLGRPLRDYSRTPRRSLIPMLPASIQARIEIGPAEIDLSQEAPAPAPAPAPPTQVQPVVQQPTRQITHRPVTRNIRPPSYRNIQRART